MNELDLKLLTRREILYLQATTYYFVYCKNIIILVSSSKSRRPRQRERHQTKGFFSKTIAVHVHCKSLYSSLSSAKQQREMTNFWVVYRTWTTTANFSYFHLELNAVVAYFSAIDVPSRSKQSRILLEK